MPVRRLTIDSASAYLTDHWRYMFSSCSRDAKNARETYRHHIQPPAEGLDSQTCCEGRWVQLESIRVLTIYIYRPSPYQ